MEGLGYIALAFWAVPLVVVGGIAKSRGVSTGKALAWGVGGAATVYGALALRAHLSKAAHAKRTAECGPPPNLGTSQEQRALWYDCVNARR